MDSFRAVKRAVQSAIETRDYEKGVALLGGFPPEALVGPLFANLPRGGEYTAMAAGLLGWAAGRMADSPDGQERVAVVIRRLMWHMNDESGNIGWGIPEAFAEVLAARRNIAERYGRILITYVLDTGHPDNFCDHTLLRQSCYRGIMRLIDAWPDLPFISGLGSLCSQALLAGSEKDPDEGCRRLAAEAKERLDAARHRLSQGCAQ